MSSKAPKQARKDKHNNLNSSFGIIQASEHK